MKSSRFVDERTITVRPGDVHPVSAGFFSLGEGEDTIWIRVTSVSGGDCPWPWSYGLLTWVTDEGRELGTVKINGVCEGEVFRLGVGLAPSLLSGELQFTPRNYNLKWIDLGNPWTLKFAPKSGSSSALPPAGNNATLMVPIAPDIPLGNAQPTYELLDGLAYLFFNLFLK